MGRPAGTGVAPPIATSRRAPPSRGAGERSWSCRHCLSWRERVALVSPGGWSGETTTASCHCSVRNPGSRFSGRDCTAIRPDGATQGLARTDSFDVISDVAVDAASAAGSSRQADILKRVTESLHPDMVITGTFGRLGDSLHFQATVVDGRSGVATHVVTHAAIASDTVALIGTVTERIIGSMLRGPLARWLEITGPPPAYSAYVELEAARDLRLHGARAVTARPLLRRAIAQDSDFVRAYITLADTYWDANMPDSVEWILNVLDSRQTRLSSVDRLLIEEYRAELAGDLEHAFTAANRYWTRTSDPYGAHVFGGQALALLRPTQALAAFRAAAGAETDMVPVGVDGNAMYQGAALHQAGRYGDQIATVRRAREYTLGVCHCLPFSMFSAFAGLHDAAGAVAFADSLLAEDNNPGDLRATAAVRLGASEFRAHGITRSDTETVRRLVDVTLTWFQRHQAAKPSFPRDTAEGLTWLLGGNLDSAETHLRAASRTKPDVAVAGYLGIIAAQRRDTAQALAIADSLVRTAGKMGPRRGDFLARSDPGCSWEISRCRSTPSRGSTARSVDGDVALRRRAGDPPRQPAVRRDGPACEDGSRQGPELINPEFRVPFNPWSDVGRQISDLRFRAQSEPSPDGRSSEWQTPFGSIDSSHRHDRSSAVAFDSTLLTGNI